MKIPQKYIEQWVRKHFDPKPARNGTELLIPNPFRGDDKYKFSISLTKGICSDWRDDNPWAGPPSKRTGKRDIRFIRFVEVFLGCSRTEALRDIFGNSPIIYDYTNHVHIKEHVSELAEYEEPSGTCNLDNSYHSSTVVNYLLHRGYTNQQIEIEGIRRIDTSILWTFKEFGEDVYYQTRSVISKSFWFPPIDDVDENGTVIAKHKFGKDDYVYGFDLVERSKYIIITESIFNRMTLWDQAISVGSSSMSDTQLAKIKILNPKNGIIIAFDRDKSGIDGAIKAASKIEANGIPAFFAIPPDVDGAGVNDWNDLKCKLKLPDVEISKIFEASIVRSTLASRTKLLQLSYSMAKFTQPPNKCNTSGKKANTCKF